MPLVHVEPLDGLAAQRPEHPHAADAQDHLLAEPVVRVAAVEEVGQRPIPVGVLRQVGVQEIDRDLAAADPHDRVPPAADRDGPPLDLDGGPLGHLLQEVLDHPLGGLLASAGRSGRASDRSSPCDAGASRRPSGTRRSAADADGVAGQDAQAPGVGRDPRLEPDLHREVGDDVLSIHAGLRLPGSPCPTHRPGTDRAVLALSSPPSTREPRPSAGPPSFARLRRPDRGTPGRRRSRAPGPRDASRRRSYPPRR